MPKGLTFPERLRAARTAAGLTQRQAAKRAQCHMITWSRWECGIKSPGVDRLDKIAKALGVTAESLVQQCCGGTK
ncbi:helix-turn-helix domain-containing protein [Candidatus Pacearchaeota archaeon]|nr:helix-turn-helix domain-containing protein [Candidatus Pacearchaeota archaeon]